MFSVEFFEVFSEYRSFRLCLIIFGFTLYIFCDATIFNINLFEYNATSRVMKDIHLITCNDESCYNIYVKIDITYGETIQEVSEISLL